MNGPSSLVKDYFLGPQVKGTTLMLRNIPSQCSQLELLEEINSLGYEGTFNFFYLPCDFETHVNKSYAFINFLNTETAKHFTQQMKGYRLKCVSMRKRCDVSIANVQGFRAYCLRYTMSPVLSDLPYENQPMIFHNSMRVPFPTIPEIHSWDRSCT